MHDFEFIGRKIQGDKDEPTAAGFAGVNFWNIAFVEMLWVDEPYRNQGIKNGVIPSGSLVYSDEQIDGYIGLRIIAETGELPFQLTGAYVYNLSDPDNTVKFNGALAIILAEAAVFAAVAIIRNRLAGLGAAVGMAGYCGAACAILSGGLASDLGLYVTKTKLCVLAAVTAFFAFVMLSLLDRFNRSLGSSTPFRAAREAFSAAEKRGAVLLAVLIAVTAVIASQVITGGISSS